MDKTSSSETENRTQKNAARGETAVDAAIAQVGRMKNVGVSIRDEVEGYVGRQPLAAIGVAVGAGFVLGSFFGSRLGRLALLAAVGYAAQEVIEGALGEGGVRKLLADEVARRATSAKSARAPSHTS